MTEKALFWAFSLQSFHWEINCYLISFFFLYVIFFFSLVAFHIYSLLCILIVSRRICPRGFLFWSCLFVVLDAFCIYTGISSLSLVKFSSIILLNLCLRAAVLVEALIDQLSYNPGPHPGL